MFDELLTSFGRQIEVIDIGAGINVHGISQDIYYSLYKNGLCNVTGFEANEEELIKRNEAYSGDDRVLFLPYIIGNGKTCTFNINRSSATSSLLEPNYDILNKFQRLSDSYLAMESKVVKTTRLDDIEELGKSDFIKLDIQGAEGYAIDGGQKVFGNALVVHAEVSFIQVYKDQPLFSDIDLKLRSLGYCFNNFLRLFSRQMKPMILHGDEFSAGGQLLWCDGGIWIKNLFNLERQSDAELAVTATIMHFGYTSIDVVGHILHELDKRKGTDWLNTYIALHSQE